MEDKHSICVPSHVSGPRSDGDHASIPSPVTGTVAKKERSCEEAWLALKESRKIQNESGLLWEKLYRNFSKTKIDH